MFIELVNRILMIKLILFLLGAAGAIISLPIIVKACKKKRTGLKELHIKGDGDVK